MVDQLEKPANNSIMVLDDHPVIREGLIQIINLEPDLLVGAEAGTVKETLKAVEKQEFNLVLVDIVLNGTTGI
jgi:DNA-binding NarL/FixJ family response regulator